MPAFSKSQAEEQIKNAIQVATKLAQVQVLIYKFLENEEVVTQNWNQLGTDFPSLVGGTQQNTDPVILDGVEQEFSPQHLNQFDNAIQKLNDALNGTDITVTANLGRNIRRLTSGIV